MQKSHTIEDPYEHFLLDKQRVAQPGFKF